MTVSFVVAYTIVYNTVYKQYKDNSAAADFMSVNNGENICKLLLTVGRSVQTSVPNASPKSVLHRFSLHTARRMGGNPWLN